VTARTKAERALNDAEQQLRQSQKMEAIGGLAGGIAHDFNNLLAGILGAATMLKLDAPEGSSASRFSETILDAAKRGSKLTGQLLGFARQRKPRMDAVNVVELLDGVIGILSHTIDRRIEIAREGRDKAFVLGDQTQLQQVFLNIGMNARDAMEGGGKLVFSTEEANAEGLPAMHRKDAGTGRFAVVRARDTGVGISKEALQRVFDPFFTTKEVGKGTGLGLSTAYGIVMNHGGWIDIDSEEGKGTTVTVCLPSAEEPVRRPAQPPEPLRGSGKLLFVDDEEMLRKVGETMLSLLGYEVVCASNGEEALDYYRRHQNEIDLVILDLTMPLMDGMTCFSRLKEIDPGVKVLITTGHLVGEGEQLVSQGVQDVVQKPFTLDRLSKAVKRAVESP